ncbi:MAG: choice-of-anchor tandem repeat NxxGxxAF-containing protein [Planctomycetota bacterium]
MHRRSCALVLLVGLLLYLAPRASAAVRVVATTNDTAPGSSDPFSQFAEPVINGLGQVAITAFVDDFDGSSGIWSEGDGSLAKVALTGETAPGAGGATFGDFPPLEVFINDLGDVTFNAFLDDFTTTGLWSDRDRTATPLTKIALEGDPAPGTIAPSTFSFDFQFTDVAQTHDGVAFLSSLAVFSEGVGGALGKVVEPTELAPGTFRPSVNGLANFENFSPPTINNAGTVAFFAETNAGTGVDSIGDGGVWKGTGGGLEPVALQGEIAPGTSNEFSQIFGRTTTPAYSTNPIINNSGDVAFTALLTGLIGGTLRSGVWVERDDVLAKVMLESEPAPGAPGFFFDRLQHDPFIDADGNAVVQVALDDGREGVWQESSPGVLDLVALQGGALPDTSETLLNIIDIAVNDSGQIALFVDLSDFNQAIYTTDSTGALTKVVQIGDFVDVNGTPFEVQQLYFNGAQLPFDNTASGLSNNGQIAYAFDGEDDQFNFVSAVVVADGPPAGTTPGDFDLDGDVDVADLVLWNRGGSPVPNSLADLNDWRMNAGFGSAQSAVTAIPEPATTPFAAVFLLSLAKRRKK